MGTSRLLQLALAVAAAVAAAAAAAAAMALSPPALVGDAEMTAELLSHLSAPDGIAVSAFVGVDGVPDARSLALGSAVPAGSGWIVYVSTRFAIEDGAVVYAVLDTDADGVADEVRVIIDDLNVPNGIATRGGDLYVASDGGVVHVFRDADAQVLAGATQLLAPPELITDAFPPEGHHGWKYIVFSPDDNKNSTLLVPVGAPCDTCDAQPAPNGVEFNTIYELDVDSGELRGPIARGVRNTVGIAYHPDSGAVLFTENGSDDLGDDLPDCELNVVPAADAASAAAGAGDGAAPYYGFPFCHTDGNPLGDPYARAAGSGELFPDPKLNPGGSVADCSAPGDSMSESGRPAVQALGPHTVPLGLTVYDSDVGGAHALPAKYDRSALVALKGSGARTDLIGYSVVAVYLSEDGQTSLGQETLLEGCLAPVPDDVNPYTGVRCRPVDVLQLPDGSVLVSDGETGSVLRLSGGAFEAPPPSPAPL